MRVDGKRIEGAREKKVGALGSPDRNSPFLPLASLYRLQRDEQVEL